MKIHIISQKTIALLSLCGMCILFVALIFQENQKMRKIQERRVEISENARKYEKLIVQKRQSCEEGGGEFDEDSETCAIIVGPSERGVHEVKIGDEDSLLTFKDYENPKGSNEDVLFSRQNQDRVEIVRYLDGITFVENILSYQAPFKVESPSDHDHYNYQAHSAISKNDEYIAYQSYDGLYLYDMLAQSQKQVLSRNLQENREFDLESPTWTRADELNGDNVLPGAYTTYPREWTDDGRLILTAGFYEGGGDVIYDPSDDSIDYFSTIANRNLGYNTQAFERVESEEESNNPIDFYDVVFLGDGDFLGRWGYGGNSINYTISGQKQTIGPDVCNGPMRGIPETYKVLCYDEKLYLVDLHSQDKKMLSVDTSTLPDLVKGKFTTEDTITFIHGKKTNPEYLYEDYYVYTFNITTEKLTNLGKIPRNYNWAIMRDIELEEGMALLRGIYRSEDLVYILIDVDTHEIEYVSPHLPLFTELLSFIKEDITQ